MLGRVLAMLRAASAVTPFVDGSGERVRVGAGRANPAFQPPYLRPGTRKP